MVNPNYEEELWSGSTTFYTKNDGTGWQRIC